MKIKNISSPSGNPVPNQFIITGAMLQIDGKEQKGQLFQSYDSNIVFCSYTGKIYLDSYYWDYSKTTGKYRNIFLGESKTETQKKIDSGKYTLTDLNK